MSVQIFGTEKCNNTKKALRYFKERNIEIHFVDLSRKGISPGELKKIKTKIPVENIIDREGNEYKKRNLQYIRHDIEEELLEHPLLFRTPIVRQGADVSIGYNPQAWEKMAVKP